MAYSDRRSKVLGCGLLLVLAVAGFWLTMTLMYPGPHTSAIPRPFNSIDWKKAGASDGARCGMLADLRFRVGLSGRSRAEVTAMLGPADDEDQRQATSHWHLCPSFMDIWILEVRWLNDRVVDDWVRDS